MKKGFVFIMAASLLMVASCKKKGCTDPIAVNYSTEAEKDDGSCNYELTTIYITEDITENTTWTANYIYVIDKYSLNITDNAILTIEPGTSIRVNDGNEITVSYGGDNGRIIANGTAENPIVFTSNSAVKEPGKWDGIWIYTGGDNCEFDYCIFEYGSDDWNEGTGALNFIGGENAIVKHSIFRYNKLGLRT
ncbi:MAG: hypothetical protein GQ574_28890 [Crocinitomix sp.]|nr:hypothetical protein [Crocinitomix sp.]